MLILTGAGQFHLIHGFAISEGERDRVGVGVVIPHSPSTQALDQALSALSLASDYLRPAVAALSDPEVVAKYLEVRTRTSSAPDAAQTLTPRAPKGGVIRGRTGKSRHKRRSKPELAAAHEQEGK